MSPSQEPVIADLQVHSKYSDGTHAPAELVRLAAQRGLQALALTDHDSILGVEEALQAATAYGVEVIPAIELSTASEPARDLIDLDILGYWIDHRDPGLQEILERVMAARREQKIALIRRLQELGLDVPEEEVLSLAQGVPGRPHIAEVVWRRNPGRFRSKQQIFDELLSPEGAAYVPRTFSLTAEQAIEVVRAAGGLPVLAHPGLYRRVRDITGAIRRLRDAGLIGLEVWYPYEKAHHLGLSPQQARAMTTHFHQLATELGLLATGGSDYHGERSPHIELGECGMTRQAFDALKAEVRSRP